MLKLVKLLEKLLLILLVNLCVLWAEDFKTEWLEVIGVIASHPLDARNDREKTKQQIIQICKEIDASIPVVMAIARIESNFNTKSVDKGGACVGIFQLKNGYGGCCGADRLDLAKSIKCLHLNHQKLKRRWIKEFGASSWEDWFYYGIHQKGYTGFKEIYKNKDKLLIEISEVRRRSIMLSKPSRLDWERVSDWWDYYRTRFYKVYNENRL